MAYPAFQILAASDNDLAKLVMMILAGAIVGIGSLVSAAKRKQKEREEQQRHGENWDRIQEEMRQRAANAARALSQQPGGYGQMPPPPPLPQQAPPVLPPGVNPYPAARRPPPPPPVFAPTRSIDGAYAPPRPPPRRQVPKRPVPVPARPTQVAQPMPRQPQLRRPKIQKQTRFPPEPPVAPARTPLPPAIPAAATSEGHPAASSGARLRSSADAAALSRWLTPTTLRSQFILTEILQPPLALRPPVHGPA